MILWGQSSSNSNTLWSINIVQEDTLLGEKSFSCPEEQLEYLFTTHLWSLYGNILLILAWTGETRYFLTLLCPMATLKTAGRSAYGSGFQRMGWVNWCNYFRSLPHFPLPSCPFQLQESWSLGPQDTDGTIIVTWVKSCKWARMAQIFSFLSFQPLQLHC